MGSKNNHPRAGARRVVLRNRCEIACHGVLATAAYGASSVCIGGGLSYAYAGIKALSLAASKEVFDAVAGSSPTAQFVYAAGMLMGGALSCNVSAESLCRIYEIHNSMKRKQKNLLEARIA